MAMRSQKLKRPDGRIVYVVGYTGCGKTAWTMQQVAAAPRLLIWDGKGEADQWAGRGRCIVVTSWVELAQRVLPSAAPARIAFRVPVCRENFERFCRLAWVYIRAHGGPLVVEELADVTTSSKAPLAWGEICRKSRAFGSWVYALTQRPQEVDKTVQGNASIFHCGMMADAMDARYVAHRLLLVPPAQVEALQPLEFIERNARTRQVITGRTNPRARK